MINSPLNPIGRVFDAEEMAVIARALENSNTYAICDEVYEHLTFDGRPHIPLASLPGMRERTVRVGSAGKIFSLTGWKVGWLTGPRAMISVITKAHQFITFTTSPALQLGVAHGLRREMESAMRLTARLQANRDLLARGLSELGFAVLPSEGTYFLTAGIQNLTNEKDRAFCERLVREAGVALIPLSEFFTGPDRPDTYVRFAFCKQKSGDRGSTGAIEKAFPAWLSFGNGTRRACPRPFAAHEASPVEATRVLLDRIARLDEKTNAFCLVDEGPTLEQARAAEARWITNTPLSPLDGVPVAIKDLFLTPGWPTLRGSRTIDPHQNWNDDAPVIARLKQSRCSALGQSNHARSWLEGCHGFARSPASPEIPGIWRRRPAARRVVLRRRSRHGWRPWRWAPTGGSIRIPASFSGVFGIKPQFGRVRRGRHRRSAPWRISVR